MTSITDLTPDLDYSVSINSFDGSEESIPIYGQLTSKYTIITCSVRLRQFSVLTFIRENLHNTPLFAFNEVCVWVSMVFQHPVCNDVLIFLLFFTLSPPTPTPHPEPLLAVSGRQGCWLVMLAHHVFPVFQSSPGTAAIESGGRQTASVSVFTLVTAGVRKYALGGLGWRGGCPTASATPNIAQTS